MKTKYATNMHNMTWNQSTEKPFVIKIYMNEILNNSWTNQNIFEMHVINRMHLKKFSMHNEQSYINLEINGRT